MTEPLVPVTDFRHDVFTLQAAMREKIEDGDAIPAECPLTHRFIQPDATYGCSVYAREIFMGAGSMIIGKIHRHEHLAFLLKGTIHVSTEWGYDRLVAPCTFISPAGVKRVLYIEEDAIVTTVHLTAHCGEERLEEIEKEVISPSYEDLSCVGPCSIKEIRA